MLTYIARRSLIAIGTVWAISIIVFVIIELPPGDAVTSRINELRASGLPVSEKEADNLRKVYALDRPIFVRYGVWIKGMVRGKLGRSFAYGRRIEEIIGERLVMTIVITLAAAAFTWMMVIPIGLYSSVRQYSIGDYAATFVGFLGLAVPDFLLGLVLMFVIFKYFGTVAGGLFSPEYVGAAWSLGRVWDLVQHLWIPAIVLGTAGTAAGIRILRANLLDELRKPYVRTARAKGLPELRLLLKYPFRVALNPFISTIGYLLPALIGGSIIVSIVLSLPTLGPVLLGALLGQDTRLASTILLLMAALTVIGTLISDILLAWIDPRIRKGFEE